MFPLQQLWKNYKASSKGFKISDNLDTKLPTPYAKFSKSVHSSKASGQTSPSSNQPSSLGLRQICQCTNNASERTFPEFSSVFREMINNCTKSLGPTSQRSIGKLKHMIHKIKAANMVCYDCQRSSPKSSAKKKFTESVQNSNRETLQEHSLQNSSTKTFALRQRYISQTPDFELQNGPVHSYYKENTKKMRNPEVIFHQFNNSIIRSHSQPHNIRFSHLSQRCKMSKSRIEKVSTQNPTAPPSVRSLSTIRKSRPVQNYSTSEDIPNLQVGIKRTVDNKARTLSTNKRAGAYKSYKRGIATLHLHQNGQGSKKSIPILETSASSTKCILPPKKNIQFQTPSISLENFQYVKKASTALKGSPKASTFQTQNFNGSQNSPYELPLISIRRACISPMAAARIRNRMSQVKSRPNQSKLIGKNYERTTRESCNTIIPEEWHINQNELISLVPKLTIEDENMLPLSFSNPKIKFLLFEPEISSQINALTFDFT